ncbi:MAG: hypothetical protein JW969_21525 [Spirochaetales bacterium]|nr:hypothetical protein [Spirochaetales bacterium]
MVEKLHLKKAKIQPGFTFNQKEEIRILIQAIKEEFIHNFDTTWFSLIQKNLPVDTGILYELHHSFFTDSRINYSNSQIMEFTERISLFIETIRLFLLPTLKEKMGISRFKHDEKRSMDQDEFLVRSMIAYTLPYNLNRLDQLVTELACILKSKSCH